MWGTWPYNGGMSMVKNPIPTAIRVHTRQNKERQRSSTEIRYCEAEQRSYGTCEPYPFGLRGFARPATLLVEAVVSDYYLLLAPRHINQPRSNAIGSGFSDIL